MKIASAVAAAGLTAALAAPAAAMTKADLIESLAEKVGIDKQQARRSLDSFIDHTKKAIAKDDRVKLVGFGTFTIRKRPARAGRNPQTGQPIHIAAHPRPVGRVKRRANGMINVRALLPHNGLVTQEQTLQLMLPPLDEIGDRRRAQASFSTNASHSDSDPGVTLLELVFADEGAMNEIFGPPNDDEVFVLNFEFPAGQHYNELSEPEILPLLASALFDEFLPSFFPENQTDACAERLLGAELGLARGGFCRANGMNGGDGTPGTPTGGESNGHCMASDHELERLVLIISEDADITREQAIAAIEVIAMEGASVVMMHRARTQLAGFGAFSRDDRPARRGRNPQTGEMINIRARTVLKFKAGRILKEVVQ